MQLFSGDDFVGAHHFVVFMFENVAMPDIAEFVAWVHLGSGGEIETGDYTRDVSGIGFDRVFPGGAFV
jgi:hypothetical protein